MAGQGIVEEEHCHRWRIEEQGAERSRGVCDCGEERLFSNIWEERAYVSRTIGPKLRREVRR